MPTTSLSFYFIIRIPRRSCQATVPHQLRLVYMCHKPRQNYRIWALALIVLLYPLMATSLSPVDTFIYLGSLQFWWILLAGYEASHRQWCIAKNGGGYTQRGMAKSNGLRLREGGLGRGLGSPSPEIFWNFKVEIVWFAAFLRTGFCSSAVLQEPS